MRELVVAAKGELDSNAERLDRHNGHTADRAAYRQVDHWVLLAILGRHSVDHDAGEYGDNQAVEHEAWLHGQVQQLFNGLDIWIWRRMEDDDDRACEAYRASDLP